jgi:hypothetical protein
MRSSVIGTTLLEDADGGVLTLTLNRPERRNAIDPELRDALAAAIDRAATDEDVRRASARRPHASCFARAASGSCPCTAASHGSSSCSGWRAPRRSSSAATTSMPLRRTTPAC